MEESSTYRELIERGFNRGIEQGREQGIEQGREQGIEQGREQGIEQGRGAALRHAVLALVDSRLGRPPEGLEARLAALDADGMDALFVALLHATDEAAFRTLLAPRV